MRLIDADALKNRIDVIINSMIDGDETETELKFFNMINHVLHTSVDETPTIEAEPVRRGRWVRVNSIHGLNAFKCSECNGYIGRITAFCSTCGARMDGAP